MILIAFTCAVPPNLFYESYIFFALVTCEGIIFILGVWLNVGILKNVRVQTENSIAQHSTVNATLTKTILLIVAMMLIAYVPLTVHMSIIQYANRNRTNFHSTMKVVKSV